MVIEVAARIGAVIVHAAGRGGADVGELSRVTGFDPAMGRDPDARIPLELEETLWEEAARRTGDDAFGLHAAEQLRPGAFDVIDYAIRTAPTARVALERVARYNRLEHDVAVFTLSETHGVLRAEHGFQGTSRLPCRHASEFTLAALVVVGGQITGGPFGARAVGFRHAAPAVTREHARIFGVEPRFSTPVNEIEFEAELVDRPCPAADPALSRVIERHAEALMAARPDPTERVTARVRRRVASLLPEGDATLARVAADFKMSERSLQRRLADEGVSFDALLDELRHELSLRYLADPKIAIAEVAYLTGYSEPSAFHRAFKRWTGVTPAEARRRAA